MPSFAGNWPVLEPFSPTHTNLQALLAGLWNSLKVALSAIVLCTMFGTLVGIGRLSTNWLVRNLCFGLVEAIRNTPLLIQIVFWYFAVVLRFPPANAASNWFGGLLASRSGVFLPGLVDLRARRICVMGIARRGRRFGCRLRGSARTAAPVDPPGRGDLGLDGRRASSVFPLALTFRSRPGSARAEALPSHRK